MKHKRLQKKNNFVITSKAGYWDRPLSVFVLVFLSVGLMLASRFSPDMLSGVRGQATDILAPTISKISAPFQSVVKGVRNVTGIAKLQKRNALLEAENYRLRMWYQKALSLEAENASLKELLNVKVAPSQKFVTARIISGTGLSFVKTMLIDVGLSDDVEKNSAVLSNQGLVGRVIEASENTSRILLLTDVNSRLPVMIEGVKQKAILAGTNADHSVLEHLPIGVSIPLNARVLTSGDGGVFSYGIPVGKVVSVDGKKPKVMLFSDLNSLSHVKVVSKNHHVGIKSLPQ